MTLSFFAGAICGRQTISAKADTIEYNEYYEYTLTGKLQGIRLYQSTTISTGYAEIMSDVVIKYNDSGIVGVSRSSYSSTTQETTYTNIPINITDEGTQNISVTAKIYTTYSNYTVTTIPLTLYIYNASNNGRNTPTQFLSQQATSGTSPTYAEYNSDITQSGVWIAKFACQYPNETANTGYTDKQTIFVYIQNQTYMNNKYFLNRTPQVQTIKFGNYPQQTYQQGLNEGYTKGYADGKASGENGLEQYGTQKYNEGYNDGAISANQNTFKSLFFSIADAEIKIFRSMLNFDFLGYNILNFVTAIITITIAIWIIRFIL